MGEEGAEEPWINLNYFGYSFWCGCQTPRRALPKLPRFCTPRSASQMSPTSTVRSLSEEALEEAMLTHSRPEVHRPSLAIVSNENLFDQLNRRCRKVQVLEGMRDLKNLELDIAGTLAKAKEQNRAEIVDRATTLSKALQEDVTLQKLRKVHSNLAEHLGTTGLLAMAARKVEESRWTHGETEVEGMGIDLTVSFRECDEFEKTQDGPRLQLITKTTVRGWPQSLRDWLALEREVDCHDSKYYADCQNFTATVGGPEKMMACMSHIQGRSSAVGVSFEVMLMKEFCRIHDGEIPGFDAGMLVHEFSLPEDEEEYDGWKTPKKPFMCTRIGSITIKHCKAQKDNPHKCDITVVSKFGVPLPSWMVPRSVIMNIFLAGFPKTFQKMKEMGMDHFEDLGYTKRQKKYSDFYDTSDLGAPSPYPAPAG